MKYLGCLLTVLLLASCTGNTEKENTDSSSGKETSNEVQNNITEGNEKEMVDISAIPNLKEILKGKLKTFIISQNVLRAERGNIELASVSLDDMCTEFDMVYYWTHVERNYETDEEKEFKDNAEYHADIEILEFSETELKLNLDIRKKYLERSLDYYGNKYEYENQTNFNEVLVVSLVNDTNTEEDKVSALYTSARGRRIKREELLDFSADELGYLRNEFYARKGYKFKTQKMQNYFAVKDWYEPKVDDLTDLLSPVELENVFYIKAMEAELEINSSNAERTQLSNLYNTGRERKLNADDLKQLNAHQLAYLRNEFYARKGYIFSSERLANYFSQTTWYEAKYDNVDDLLTDLEVQNVMFIKDLELSKK